MTSKRFVVLDRDGTIIVHHHYLASPGQVELLPKAAVGLRQLDSIGLGLVVATNQSAVGRGIIDQTQLDLIHCRMLELLAAEGVCLDGIYACPHRPEEECACRKPKPGLVLRAAREIGFDPQASFVVGDNECDVDLAKGLGVPSVLVRTGYGVKLAEASSTRPDHVAADLTEAAEIIGQLLSERIAREKSTAGDVSR